jgi:hypothetical protein
LDELDCKGFFIAAYGHVTNVDSAKNMSRTYSQPSNLIAISLKPLEPPMSSQPPMSQREKFREAKAAYLIKAWNATATEGIIDDGEAMEAELVR